MSNRDISSHSCFQKNFYHLTKPCTSWKNFCCIFISIYSKTRTFFFFNQRTVNLTIVNKFKDNKIKLLWIKIICVKSHHSLIYYHMQHVEYLPKSCQFYVLHSDVLLYHGTRNPRSTLQYFFQYIISVNQNQFY